MNSLDVRVALFRALADVNRLRILEHLRQGEKCACELLSALNISQSTLSHHMAILQDAGLVQGRPYGKWTYYRLSSDALAELEAYVSAFAQDSQRISEQLSRVRVAFVCIQNSCRSQMAEAFAKKLLGPDYDVVSAGTEPSDKIHPMALKIMQEHFGCDMTCQYPKHIQEVAPIDVVVTMGCGVACPHIAGQTHIELNIADPKDMDEVGFIEVAKQIQAEVERIAVTLAQDLNKPLE